MKLKIKRALLVLVLLLVGVLASCGDQKRPVSGYINEEELNEIINTFDGSVVHTSYSVEGSMNYFGLSENELCGDVDAAGVPFVNYPEYGKHGVKTSTFFDCYYLDNCASYYLRLPLVITDFTWNHEDDNYSTRYQLEAKLFRSAGTDKLYYYERPEGGFILRGFGVNKELLINNTNLWEYDLMNGLGNFYDIVDCVCSAKWNFTVEYDADGYLVYEKFETVNASVNNKDNCCYGQATYTWE